MHEELSGQDITSVTFPQARRRGYQPEAVDRYLQDLAVRVDGLQAQIHEQERSERAAMLLLQQAQQTADQTLESARDEARETVETARAEAKQRLDGTDAQIESAFAEASARLTDLERQVHARRRELAMLQAGSARFAEDHASRLREQAEVLLAAADSITAGPSSDDVGGSAEPGSSEREATEPDADADADDADLVDIRERVQDVLAH